MPVESPPFGGDGAWQRLSAYAQPLKVAKWDAPKDTVKVELDKLREGNRQGNLEKFFKDLKPADIFATGEKGTLTNATLRYMLHTRNWKTG